MVSLDPGGGAVSQFLALEASGWKGEAGTAFAAARRTLVSSLRCAAASPGRAAWSSWPFAARAGRSPWPPLVARESRYAFKIAFDEEFRKQSPGTQLIVELTENPPNGEAHYLDSCADRTTRS